MYVIVTNPFLLQVNMAEPRLTQEMKMHAIIISLAVRHADSEISAFLKVAQSFVLEVQRELGAARGDVATVSHRKRHCRRSDIIRTPEFVSSVQAAIDEDPGKSKRALARELQPSEQDETSGGARNVMVYLR